MQDRIFRFIQTDYNNDSYPSTGYFNQFRDLPEFFTLTDATKNGTFTTSVLKRMKSAKLGTSIRISDISVNHDLYIIRLAEESLKNKKRQQKLEKQAVKLKQEIDNLAGSKIKERAKIMKEIKELRNKI